MASHLYERYLTTSIRPIPLSTGLLSGITSGSSGSALENAAMTFVVDARAGGN